MSLKALIPLALALGLLASPAMAQPTKTNTAQEAQYQILIAGYKRARAAYLKPVHDARNEAERQRQLKTLDKQKDPALPYIEMFAALEKRARPSDTGAEALLAIINLTGKPEVERAAFAQLVDLYQNSPILGKAVRLIWLEEDTIGVPQSRDYLRQIAAKSPHRAVQAAALVNLGSSLTQNPKATDADRAEVRTLLERVASGYAETDSAAHAQNALFDLNRLQVGMAAPEIEGVDQDGAPFRLSELRGRVVVLDFWGFW